MRTAGIRRRILIVVTLLSCLGSATSAHAAACCMSATSNGVGRLLIWETFAVGFSTSFSATVGTWFPDGQWKKNNSTYKEYEWRSELWSLVGFGRRASAFFRLPLVMGYRKAGNLTDLGAMVGDVHAGFRYEILGIGEYKSAPALAISVALTAPSGRSANSRNVSVLAANVTGRGAWVLHVGVSLEKTLLPWFVRWDVGLNVPMRAWRSDISRYQRFGPSLDTSLTGGMEVAKGIVVSVIASFTWEDSLRVNEAVIPSSVRRETALSLALSWRVDPHWTLQTSLRTGIFASHMGLNGPGRVTIAFGVRYGYF